MSDMVVTYVYGSKSICHVDDFREKENKLDGPHPGYLHLK